MRALLVVAAFLVMSGCSHQAVKTTPVLSEMLGKKVALVGIEGEATSRSIVEVALINQLVKTGNFEIASKEDVEAARHAVDIDPTDWKAIAKRVNADYALKAKVLAFDADTHKGYSEEQVEDSQLAEETGDGHTTNVYQVERMDGHCEVALTFVNLTQNGNGDTREGVADKTESVSSEAKTEAMHLPPKLRFLEKLCNEAFQEFFQKYK